MQEWSSTVEIAELLGVTTRRIQQLTHEGILEAEFYTGGNVKKYHTEKTVQRFLAYINTKEAGDTVNAMVCIKIVDPPEKEADRLHLEFGLTDFGPGSGVKISIDVTGLTNIKNLDDRDELLRNFSQLSHEAYMEIANQINKML